jgi:hypothetical protein
VKEIQVYGVKNNIIHSTNLEYFVGKLGEIIKEIEKWVKIQEESIESLNSLK